MGLVVLLQASPMVPATGAAVAVRLAGGGGRPYVDYLGFSDWRSGLNGLPRFTTELGFDQGGWNGGALPQTAVVLFKGSDKALMSTLAALFWKGARVVVSSGDDTFGAPAAWFTEMTGTVADASFSGGALQLTIADLSGDLAKPIVPDTFAGTGGVEGGDDATGRVKRRTWGRAFNIEGRLIDKANQVFEFGDPARPLQAFDMLKDKGRAGGMTALAWQGSIAATFAALQVAACPQGGGVVAPSIAMAKWYMIPSGPLTADLRGETLGGYVESPTDVTSRIIATRSTINPVLSLSAVRNYPAGLHADDSSETVANALDRLLLPCSLAWSLSPAGTITITEWTWTGPVETLTSQEVTRETVFSPLLSRKLGFQKNQRVQNDSEISAVLLLATDATYADGTPLETLKPAQAGADVTALGTAAAITAQGPGATAAASEVLNSAVTIGSDGKLSGAGGGQATYSGLGGKQLGLLSSLFFGSQYFTETDGGAAATLDAFKTILGSAASFLGQGQLATKAAVRLGSATSILGSLVDENNAYVVTNAIAVTSLGSAASFFGQNSLATKAAVRLGSETGNLGALVDENNGYVITNAIAVTSLGSAASFFGQGQLATLSRVTLSTTQIVRADGTTTVTEAAVVTELGNAASFTGQGKGATSNSLADLDKSANDKLNAVGSGGSLAGAYGVSVGKVLSPGQSVSLEGAVYREAGGNSGTITCIIMGGPAGAATQLASVAGDAIGPSEPGGAYATATYTNNTSSKQNFAFYVTDSRSPTTAGGAIRASNSYIIVT